MQCSRIFHRVNLGSFSSCAREVRRVMSWHECISRTFIAATEFRSQSLRDIGTRSEWCAGILHQDLVARNGNPLQRIFVRSVGVGIHAEFLKVRFSRSFASAANAGAFGGKGSAGQTWSAFLTNRS